jgi:hypothetical protein
MKIGGICGECGKYYKGESCPKCTTVTANNTLNFISDFHEDYYDHGLGQIIKSRSHRKSVMKDKGLIEVGNERSSIDAEKREQRNDRRWKESIMEVNKEAYHVLSRNPEWN